MLQTVKAEIDVNGNVRLLEPINIGKPTRALVTLLDETVEQVQERADIQTRGNAAAALEFLRTHRLPKARGLSAEEQALPEGNAAAILELLRSPEFAARKSYPAEEIEARIEENRNSWD